MNYYIIKSLRYSHGQKGVGHIGPWCEPAGIELKKVYTDFDEACDDCDLLTTYNPAIGYRVYTDVESVYLSPGGICCSDALSDDEMLDFCPECDDGWFKSPKERVYPDDMCFNCGGRGTIVVPRTRTLPKRKVVV